MYHIFSVFFILCQRELNWGRTTRDGKTSSHQLITKWPISSHFPVRRCHLLNEATFLKKSKQSRRQGTSWTITGYCYRNSSKSWSGSSIMKLLNKSAVTFHFPLAVDSPFISHNGNHFKTKTTKTLGLTFKTKYLRSYHVMCHLLHFILTNVSPLINTSRMVNRNWYIQTINLH